MASWLEVLENALGLGGPSTIPVPPPAAPVAPAPAPDGVPDEAVALVKEFEGFRSAPYQDSTGVWTFGYGSTRDADGNPVTAATPLISEPAASALVRRDLDASNLAVTRDVHVPLTANQRAALDDFIYNLGVGNFQASAMLKLLNAGDYAGAAAQIDLWDHAGGVVLAGLLRRRQAETDMFTRTA